LKLLDDITQPSGITMKPTDSQFKLLGQKLKNLNKGVILNAILEKLNNYKNMTYGNNIKSFIVICNKKEITICYRLSNYY
jgi:hypothetical protein